MLVIETGRAREKLVEHKNDAARPSPESELIYASMNLFSAGHAYRNALYIIYFAIFVEYIGLLWVKLASQCRYCLNL